ncbi:MAG: hypothetical protein A2408_00135 [Candidatus Yonathbacteria bacterium RIFOXYC1_FULL_52_10]|uniref:Uncharacterized protein n=1 Tax=Candidatus Yonathbacteria bacterium RIFOXYD1_FULL_52_36 TaxID=1802730 RepID=A0A1G2SM74_9BACT|nr:MAG: hypothetical protein A2408_00135 [Candidatus Yonathbacteria bacterium RIFOXYC1_FULL_52_10]OHA85491.1 MAG: hypothetical protein A2591_01385 [Candidatus Yonathbacteria bacterium RIFOXYD1_FULL_52_36]
MPKFNMPSPEELAQEYGEWEQNIALREASNWSLSGDSEEHLETLGLEHLWEQRAHFEQFSEQLEEEFAGRG